jgi:hypothetical protein
MDMFLVIVAIVVGYQVPKNNPLIVIISLQSPNQSAGG